MSKPLDLIPIIVGEDGLYLDMARLRPQPAQQLVAEQFGVAPSGGGNAWAGEDEMDWWRRNRHNLGSLSANEGHLFDPEAQNDQEFPIGQAPVGESAMSSTPSAPGAWVPVPTSGPEFAGWDEMPQVLGFDEMASLPWPRGPRRGPTAPSPMSEEEVPASPLWQALTEVIQRDAPEEEGPLAVLQTRDGAVVIELTPGGADALTRLLESSLGADESLRAMFGTTKPTDEQVDAVFEGEAEAGQPGAEPEVESPPSP